MKTLVIAGNRQQADLWIRRNLDKRSMSGVTTLSWSDYIVVSDVDKIRGISDPTGVFVGTWIERKDLAGIFQQLLTASDITTNKHRTINTLWGRWKEHHDSLLFKPTIAYIKKSGMWNIMDTNPLSFESRVASITTGLPPDAIKNACLKINGGVL